MQSSGQASDERPVRPVLRIEFLGAGAAGTTDWMEYFHWLLEVGFQHCKDWH
jgi:hypothetical protein